MENQINATIIKDSIGPMEDRLTSVIGEFPRIVLAEFNTHKMISKNSASSRAIPPHKMKENLLKNPFIPIAWMKEHSGMQGTEYFNEEESQILKNKWKDYRFQAIEKADEFTDLKLTKQISNRLLEPFMIHKVLASATDWQNFFALRAEKHAEIHIQDFAYKLLEQFNNSTPTRLKEGEWHLPFNLKDSDEQKEFDYFLLKNYKKRYHYEDYTKEKFDIWTEMLLKIVTARCARTSYNNFEGNSDFIKDIKMHDDNLVKNGHWSPFEHPAKCMTEEEYFSYGHLKLVDSEYIEINKTDFDIGKSDILERVNNKEFKIIEYGWCGNYRGFIQYRKLFSQENRKDSRVLIK